MAYTAPTPANLIARYPAFTAVAEPTIQYWLTDAERFVDTSWLEGDYAQALMAMAGHNMALAGLGTDGAAVAGIPAGVTKLKSGTLDVTFADGAAADRVTGALTGTRYGSEFAMLRRRSKGGPRVTPTGCLPYDPTRHPQGEA